MRKCKPVSHRCGGIFDIQRKRRDLNTLEQKAAAPGFWDQPETARETIELTNSLRAVVAPFRQLEDLLEDVAVMLEMASEEQDARQRRAAEKEVLQMTAQAEALLENLEFQSLLSAPYDHNNAYLSVHAGAGGTESCDWAEMLLRMVRRYAENRGWGIALLDLQPGDEAGIKHATVLVSGVYAFGHLKAERGVHRLVRISPFDAAKRRHTSFASVDIVAELDDAVEVAIDEGHLRVDTFRSSGAGGQHVNTTDSAVRITHLPTGIVVQCRAERSQHANRNKAMKMLRAHLHEWEEDRKRKDMERFYGEKGEIAWGRQIRSYVLQPYTMVKDHRTGTETGNVQAVLEGHIEEFITSYLRASAAREQQHGA